MTPVHELAPRSTAKIIFQLFIKADFYAGFCLEYEIADAQRCRKRPDFQNRDDEGQRDNDYEHRPGQQHFVDYPKHRDPAESVAGLSIPIKENVQQ